MATINDATKESEVSATTLAAIFGKRGKLVIDMVRAKENARSAFIDFVSPFLTAEAKNDWSGNAPKTFTTVAFVQPESETLPARLIGIADKETVLSDPIVSQRLYQNYVSRVVAAASKDDAEEADFIIVAGTYRQAHDMQAFTFQASAVCDALKKQHCKGMTTKLLRQSLENAAFARSQFPRITDQSWELIINVMIAKATERNLDTSIFAHWTATRNVKIDTGSTIDLSGFDAIVGENITANEAEKAAA